MSNYQAAYEILAAQLTDQGIDVEAVKTALKNQRIETPSWGYANSGTRFKAFAWPGAATTTHQKLDDAAMVHKMTGIAPTVAVHIPWDKPEDGDYDAMGQYAKEQGIAIGAVNPNVFQDDEYKLGSLGSPDPGVQEQALDHILECCEIMEKVDSDALSLWFADGTNYAGQDNLRARKRRFERHLATVYDHLPADGYVTVLAAAAELGMDVVGHVPDTVRLTQVINSGQVDGTSSSGTSVASSATLPCSLANISRRSAL